MADEPLAPNAILTADPDSVGLARDELLAAMPELKETEFLAGELAEGVLLAALPQGFASLARVWRKSPPIFVRHMNPVQVIVPLAGGVGDVAALREAALAQLAEGVDPARSFSVQTRLLADVEYGAYDVNTALAGAIGARWGARLDVQRPHQVLSVVTARWEKKPSFGEKLGFPSPRLGFLGLSLAKDNLSDWAGGARRFAREPEQVSRSEFKLLEALEIFSITLPTEGRALDLGAAPGGWTRILRRHGLHVTAVDPGALHPDIEADRGVSHIRATVEEYLRSRPQRFDLIVNDMRMDAVRSAQVMVTCASLLYPRGQAIMTAKLPETKRERIVSATLSTLRQAYEIVGARQLFHNRSEFTLYLRRQSRTDH